LARFTAPSKARRSTDIRSPAVALLRMVVWPQMVVTIILTNPLAPTNTDERKRAVSQALPASVGVGSAALRSKRLRLSTRDPGSLLAILTISSQKSSHAPKEPPARRP
jgi:hypothetical protein